MLDRKIIRGFIKEELSGIKIPKNTDFDDLVETFCLYTEGDYYEWMCHNFKSFFNDCEPDWKWIKERIHDAKK